MNAVLLNFLLIKESWGKKEKNVLKIDDNNNHKCFLSSKSAY